MKQRYAFVGGHEDRLIAVAAVAQRLVLQSDNRVRIEDIAGSGGILRQHAHRAGGAGVRVDHGLGLPGIGIRDDVPDQGGGAAADDRKRGVRGAERRNHRNTLLRAAGRPQRRLRGPSSDGDVCRMHRGRSRDRRRGVQRAWDAASAVVDREQVPILGEMADVVAGENREVVEGLPVPDMRTKQGMPGDDRDQVGWNGPAAGAATAPVAESPEMVAAQVVMAAAAANTRLARRCVMLLLTRIGPQGDRGNVCAQRRAQPSRGCEPSMTARNLPGWRGCRPAAAAAPWSAPTIGMKFVSPPQRGHDVLVQVRRDPGAGDRALVHADVEARAAPIAARSAAHRPLGERARARRSRPASSSV